MYDRQASAKACVVRVGVTDVDDPTGERVLRIKRRMAEA